MRLSFVINSPPSAGSAPALPLRGNGGPHWHRLLTLRAMAILVALAIGFLALDPRWCTFISWR